MKKLLNIRIKNTLAAAEAMSRDGLPATVVAALVGKPFIVEKDVVTDGFIIPVFDGHWNVAAECVEILIGNQQ